MAVLDMNKEQFERALRADKPLLVDYWAPWCGYCRRLAPAYEQAAAEHADQLAAAKIDIDAEEALAEAQGIEIIPTLVLYRGGQAVGRIVNPPSKAAIDRFIRDTLDQ